MKETFYFSHDYNSRSDPKLRRVLMKQGVGGLGIYWCIIEMLYEQDGYIKLNSIESIAFELHTECDRINSILKDFELFKFKKDLFYSESVLKRINKRKNICDKNRENAITRWNKGKNTDTIAMPPHTDRNAIKLKEIKLNESNIIDTVLTFDQFWELYDKKVEKKKSELKYGKVKEKDRVLIKEHIPKYKAAQPDKNFRKNPETYLNNESWNDEIIQRNMAPKQETPDKLIIRPLKYDTYVPE